MTPTVTQANVTTALRTFLLAVLDPGWTVVLAQPNRVAEPKQSSFVVMTPIRQERLETNIDSYVDAVFTGSISGATLTISDVNSDFGGQIIVGSYIFGVGIAAGTRVTALGTGSGGIGTYTVAPSQNISSETISAGVEQITQATKFSIQMDFHSADPQAAGNAASVVSTLMRDQFAVSSFANQSPNFGVVPLLADDAAQRPFINESQQVEWRWVVEALLQANVGVGVPMQFGSVAVEVISVDAAYPAA